MADGRPGELSPALLSELAVMHLRDRAALRVRLRDLGFRTLGARMAAELSIGKHAESSSCPAAVIPTALAKPCSTGCCQIRCGSLNTARNGNTAASENTSAKPLASITSSNKPSWMRLRLLRCCQMP